MTDKRCYPLVHVEVAVYVTSHRKSTPYCSVAAGVWGRGWGRLCQLCIGIRSASIYPISVIECVSKIFPLHGAPWHSIRLKHRL